MPGKTDEELLLLAKSGDRDALSELIKRYEATIFNFAFKVCRNKDRAENTMQETFMTMVKSLGQFNGDSKFSTWLYRIVSNHCLMLARSNKKHNISSLDDDEAQISPRDVPQISATPEKLLEDTELKMELEKAIGSLPQDYKIIFLLRDIEGFSTEETAKIANLSVPAVKSRLHRARAFLRQRLEQ